MKCFLLNYIKSKPHINYFNKNNYFIEQMSLSLIEIKSKFFGRTLNKLGNLVLKLDNLVGMESEFGKKYSTVPSIDQFTSKCEKKEEPVELKQETPLENKKKEKIIKEKKDEKLIDNNDKKKVKQEKDKDESQKYVDCDLRVGKVVKCIQMEGSDNLYHCWVDIGESELREIGCGLRKYGVPIEEFTKELIVVFANLKEKKLASVMSKGMIMSAATEDEKQFELIRPAKGSVPGDSIFLEGGKPRESNAEILSSNKFAKVLLFKSDEDLNACFAGVKLQTTSGNVKVNSLKNCLIK